MESKHIEKLILGILRDREKNEIPKEHPLVNRGRNTAAYLHVDIQKPDAFSDWGKLQFNKLLELLRSETTKWYITEDGYLNIYNRKYMYSVPRDLYYFADCANQRIEWYQTAISLKCSITMDNKIRRMFNL